MGRRAAARKDATALASRRRSARASGRIDGKRFIRATRALAFSAVHVVGKPLIVVHAAYSLEVFLEKATYESDLLAARGQARLEETRVQDHVPRVCGQPALDVPHAPQAISPDGLRVLHRGQKLIRVDLLEIRVALGKVQGERVAPQEDPGAWWYETLEVLGREP